MQVDRRLPRFRIMHSGSSDVGENAQEHSTAMVSQYMSASLVASDVGMGQYLYIPFLGG